MGGLGVRRKGACVASSFCGLRVKIEVKCVAQGHPGALGADAARTATLWRFAGVMFALE